jgi:hypothetical protein
VGGACLDWCKIQVTCFDRLGAIKRRREGARGLPIYLDGHGMRPTDECTGASSAQACAGAREAASEVSMTGSSDRGDKEPDPIVEPKPGENAPPATSRALAKRIRQQEILAEIGVTALQGGGFERLLSETARLTAEGMQAEFCKILEHISGENRFLVRAGVGW